MGLFRLGFMVTCFLAAHGQSTDQPNPVTPDIGTILHFVSDLTQQIEELKTFRAKDLSTIASLEAKMDSVQLKYQKIVEENRSFGQRIKLLENRPDLPDSSNTAQQMEHEAGTQRSLRKLFVDRDHNRNGMSEDLDRSNYTADTLLVHETNDGGLAADDQSEPESLGPKVRTNKMAEMSTRYQLLKQGGSVRVAAPNTVAFHAQLSSDITDPGMGSTIKFDRVVTNFGNSYNPVTGVFTSPMEGVYVFMWSTGLKSRGVIYTQLLKNGVPAAYSDTIASNYTADSSQTSLLALSQGDVITVSILGYSTIPKLWNSHTSFGGFILN